MSRLSRPLACLIVLTCVIPAIAQPGGTEVGFVENFALAADREQVLEALIPGSQDYYYYHALHYQHTGQLDAVDRLLGPWQSRYRNDPRINVIRNRQVLLRYETDPAAALEQLRQRLGLSFNHTRDRTDRELNLPTTLDPALLGREQVRQVGLTRSHQSLNGFEPAAFEWLVADELDIFRLRDLLRRLDRPDYAKLPELIVRELNHAGSSGFGHFPIHRMLLIEQLEACLELKPELINDSTFVLTWLGKLQPGPDVDLERDLADRTAYLDRLWDFADDLPPVHNSVKAVILHHRLATDQRQGIYDRERFMRYIALPRNVGYINADLFRQWRAQGNLADLSTSLHDPLQLGVVGNDEPLVRAYLAHFLMDAPSDADFEPYIRTAYLRQVFAETKLLAGVGDAEQWYALLTPTAVQQLRDRVEISFDPANARQFTAGDPVSLDLHVKNVPHLTVRIFRINALNYYREQARPIDTTIDLDGLVPNHEHAHTFAEPPIRRVRRSFDLSELTEPGTYVVEFVGGGISSRAVVHLGRLRYVMHNGPAGHVFRILNEANQPVDGAVLHIDHHRFEPDADGRITVPYSTNPGRRTLIMARDDWATLDHFEHEAERYSLHAGFHLEREALAARTTGAVVLRPRLRISGTRLPVNMLDNATLTITSTDHDGYSSTYTRDDLSFTPGEDAIVEFQVPERLRHIRLHLMGSIESISTGETVTLEDAASFDINAVHHGTHMIQPLLTRDGGRYVIDVRGRNGEPLADHPAVLSLKHRDLAQPLPEVRLRSGERGRIDLGPLQDVESVTVRLGDITQHWPIRSPRADHRRTLTATEGSLIHVPWMRPTEAPTREELSLLEMRGSTYAINRFEHLHIADGYLVLRDLPAGDYQLVLKRDNERIGVHVVEGEARYGHALSQRRYLELTEPQPITLRPIETDDESVRIHVGHPTRDTRCT